MRRDGNTQTRTFNCDLPTGRLTSATNPENGTVSYYYNVEGQPNIRVSVNTLPTP